jgi:hypothetical protein
VVAGRWEKGRYQRRLLCNARPDLAFPASDGIRSFTPSRDRLFALLLLGIVLRSSGVGQYWNKDNRLMAAGPVKRLADVTFWMDGLRSDMIRWLDELRRKKKARVRLTDVGKGWLYFHPSAVRPLDPARLTALFRCSCIWCATTSQSEPHKVSKVSVG